MSPERFDAITGKFRELCLAVVGDFCLDRYLEIDPARTETSIETGLPVHNIVNVRSQPGAAGTILNNLVALGVGQIFPIGMCGVDGEGFELLKALRAHPGVQLDFFQQTPERRTFTYCKPLVLESGRAPRELNRLDTKNWSPTPAAVRKAIGAAFVAAAERVDGLILMDQVDVPETGVVTSELLGSVRGVVHCTPHLLMVADSRRSLKGWPSLCLKMNEYELAAMTGKRSSDLPALKSAVAALAQSNGRAVFVTLAERGVIGAEPSGRAIHANAFPVRGELDIVGAGDAVTANLTAALAAGATIEESLKLAMAAASIVVHQLGTTGTASVGQMRALLFPR